MTEKKIIVAIDGYSSCGKSTMAKDLASAIGYIYVDTGAMYRAITLYCLQHQLIRNKLVDEQALQLIIPSLQISFLRQEDGQLITMLNNVNVEKLIRGMEVSDNVSIVSSLKFVRSALVKMQQKMGEEKGIVMDGRDIGTVVFPQAELKVFVTADAAVRAKRRYTELLSKGEAVAYDAILKNIQERDYLDENRQESPLRKADDAIVLDNGMMSIEEQRLWLLNQYKKVVWNQ